MRSMKKTLLSALFVLLSITLLGQENEASAQKINRWSLGVKGGIDYYRVTPKGKDFGSNGSWAAPSIMVEYGITPYFGIGFDGGYFAYNRGDGKVYKGHTIDATLYGSLNFSNVVSPRRTGFWRHVHLYIIAGLGAGFYDYDLNKGETTGDGVSAMGFAALNLAFDLGKVVELSLEGQYRNYTSEKMGGIANPSSIFADAVVANIGFRFKLGGGVAKGENLHVRNMLPEEYYPARAAAPIAAEKEPATPTTIIAKLSPEDEARISEMEEEIRTLKGDVEQIKIKQEQTDKFVDECCDNVEFEFNSNKLAGSSTASLDKVAQLLTEDTSWRILRVYGHTDSKGSSAYNKKLSQERAVAVMNYLISKGVPSDKIVVMGFGYEKPIATNATESGRQTNRRVELEVVR